MPVRATSDYHDNQDYLTIKLAIDNGDGTWSTQKVTVTNPEYIESELARVNGSLDYITKRLKVISPGSAFLEASKGKPTPVTYKKTDAIINAGEAWRDFFISRAEDADAVEIGKLHNWQDALLKKKTELETKSTVEYDGIQDLKDVD